MLHTLAKGAGVEGIIAFTRIDANNKTHTERFAIGDVDHMTDAIIGWSSHPDLNIYASYAIFRKDLPPGAAGGEADVCGVLALVGDLDSDMGKKAVGLDGLPLQPPYVVETSANNFHAVFPLGRALSLSDAKPIAVALSNAIGGDSGTKDVSHLWRIPGTLNWPSAKKLGRGRPKTPQLVTIKSAWTGETVEPETLWEAVKGSAKTNSGPSSSGSSSGTTGNSSETFDDLPADLKKLIASPAYPGEDRSRTAASVIFKLFRRGWSNDAVQALFEEYPNGIGERYAGATARPTFKRRSSVSVRSSTRKLSTRNLSMDTLPVIQLKNGELSSLATRAEELLIAASVPIYQRGGRLVRPIIETVDASRGRKTDIAQLNVLDKVYARDLLSRHAVWEKWDARAKKPSP